MLSLGTVYGNLHIFVSYGPGLAFLLLLHEAILSRRPDIVDVENRVRDVNPSELLKSYDVRFVCLFVLRSKQNRSIQLINIFFLFIVIVYRGWWWFSGFVTVKVKN